MLPWFVSLYLHIIEGTVCFIIRGPPPPSFPNIKYPLCPVGHNFCAEAPKCGENSECKNWNTKATCECKSGYISVQGNSAFCEGKGAERPCGEVAENYGFSYKKPWNQLCQGSCSHACSRQSDMRNYEVCKIMKCPQCPHQPQGSRKHTLCLIIGRECHRPMSRDVAREFPFQMTATAWLRPSSHLPFLRAECFSS